MADEKLQYFKSSCSKALRYERLVTISFMVLGLCSYVIAGLILWKKLSPKKLITIMGGFSIASLAGSLMLPPPYKALHYIRNDKGEYQIQTDSTDQKLNAPTPN